MIETTSLELSKRLNEAGAKQESSFFWQDQGCVDGGHELKDRARSHDPQDMDRADYAALMLAEMLERLPRMLELRGYHYLRTLTGYPQNWQPSTEATENAYYWNEECGYYDGTVFEHATATEAVGLLYEWALKEGIVSE